MLFFFEKKNQKTFVLFAVSTAPPCPAASGRSKQRGKKSFLVLFFKKGLLALILSSPAAAADLGTISGFSLRLDTTVRTSLGLRLDGQDGALLANANADDGDRAFRPGVISERVDVTSQLDIARGDFGLELSADGWYDAVYHQANDNRSAVSFNPVTVAPDEFPGDVRRLQGATVELQNAFVHDKFDIAGIPVTVRVGRQTLLWGESLFFPQDGIAAGQAPIDEIKEISQPLVEDNEVYLPVSQADIRIQLPHGFSAEAYDQFEWRRNRNPGVTSYFSTSDVLDEGGQRIFTPAGALYRKNDEVPTGVGQFGAALRHDTGTLDLGLYALRYDAKEPEFSIPPIATNGYRAVFPKNIGLVGASFSSFIGNDAISGEISERFNMPLESVGSLEPENSGRYATGDTLQALASYESQLRPGRYWNDATLLMEFVATDLLRARSNAQNISPNTTRFASAVQAVFIPQYFQVLPNLDMTIPVGVGIGMSGHSGLDTSLSAGTGNVTVSISATYHTVWQGGISVTKFLGPADKQALTDRSFVTITLGRTF